MTHTFDIADGLRASTERAFRTALGRFATGITVITTRRPEGGLEGLTANAFTALSLSPPLVLWCARCSAPSRTSFERSPSFAVNVLASNQRHLSMQFASPASDKFAGVAYGEGIGGAPLIEGTLACFECRRHCRYEGGDHVIFVGRVERFSYRDGEPLLFNAGRYGVPRPHPEDRGEPAETSEFADLLL